MDEDDLSMDHEKFVGKQIPDPWEDPDQLDWENRRVEAHVELGPDEGTDQLAR